MSSKINKTLGELWEAKRIGGHVVQAPLLTSSGMRGQFVVYAVTPFTLAVVAWPTLNVNRTNEYINDNSDTINDKITTVLATDSSHMSDTFAQMKLYSLPEPQEDEIAFIKVHDTKPLLCVGTTKRGLYLTNLPSPEFTSSTRLPLSVTGEFTYDACFITFNNNNNRNYISGSSSSSNNNNSSSSKRNGNNERMSSINSRKGSKDVNNKNTVEQQYDDDILVFSSAMKGRAGMSTSRLTLWDVQNSNVLWRGPMEGVAGLTSLPHSLQFAAWTSQNVFVCSVQASPSNNHNNNNNNNNSNNNNNNSNNSNNHNSNSNNMTHKPRLRVTMCKCSTVEELSGVEYVQCVISEMQHKSNDKPPEKVNVNTTQTRTNEEELSERHAKSVETTATAASSRNNNEEEEEEEEHAETSSTSNNHDHFTSVTQGHTLLALTSNGILIAFDMTCGLVYRWMNCRVRPAHSLVLTQELIVIAGAMMRMFSREAWGVCGKLRVDASKLGASSYVTRLISTYYTAALCPLRDAMVLFTNNGELTVYQMQCKANVLTNNNVANNTITPTTVSNNSTTKTSEGTDGGERVTTIVSAKERFIGLQSCYHYLPQFHNVQSETKFVIPSRSTPLLDSHVESDHKEMMPSSTQEHSSLEHHESQRERNVIKSHTPLINLSTMNTSATMMNRSVCKRPEFMIWCPASYSVFNYALELCKTNKAESNCATYHYYTLSFITFTPTSNELVAYSAEEDWREWARLYVNSELTQLCSSYYSDRIAALDSHGNVHLFTCYWKHVKSDTANHSITLESNVDDNANVALDAANNNQPIVSDTITTTTNTTNTTPKESEMEFTHGTSAQPHYITKSLILVPTDTIDYSHLGLLRRIFFVGNTLYGVSESNLIDLDEDVVKLRDLSRHELVAACGAGRYVAVLLYNGNNNNSISNINTKNNSSNNSCLIYHIVSGALDRVTFPHGPPTGLCFDLCSNLLALYSATSIALYSVNDKLTLTVVIEHAKLKSNLFVATTSTTNTSASLSSRNSLPISNANSKIVHEHCNESGADIVTVGISSNTQNAVMSLELFVLDVRGSITVYSLQPHDEEPTRAIDRRRRELLPPSSVERELEPHTNQSETDTESSTSPLTLRSLSSSRRQLVLPLSLKCSIHNSGNNTKSSILSNRLRMESPSATASLKDSNNNNSNNNNNNNGNANGIHQVEDITTININKKQHEKEEEEEKATQVRRKANEKEIVSHYRSNSRPSRLSGRHTVHHRRTFSEDVPSCRELNEQLDALSLYAEQSEMQSRTMRNRSSSNSNISNNSSFRHYHNHHHQHHQHNDENKLQEQEQEQEHEEHYEQINSGRYSESRRDSVADEKLNVTSITATASPNTLEQNNINYYNSSDQPNASESAPQPIPFRNSSESVAANVVKKPALHHDPYVAPFTNHSNTNITTNTNNDNNISVDDTKHVNATKAANEFEAIKSSLPLESVASRNKLYINNDGKSQHQVFDSLADIQVSAMTSVAESHDKLSQCSAIQQEQQQQQQEEEEGQQLPLSPLQLLEREEEEQQEEEEWKEEECYSQKAHVKENKTFQNPTRLPPTLPHSHSKAAVPSAALIATTINETPPDKKRLTLEPEPCERSPARKGDPFLEMEVITHTGDEDTVNYASLALTHINPEKHLNKLTQEQNDEEKHTPFSELEREQEKQNSDNNLNECKSSQNANTTTNKITTTITTTTSSNKNDSSNTVAPISLRRGKIYNNELHTHNTLLTSETPLTTTANSSASSSSSSSPSLSSLTSSTTSFSPHFISSTKLLRKSLQEWTYLLNSEVNSMNSSRTSNFDMHSTITNNTGDAHNAMRRRQHEQNYESKDVQEQNKELAELSLSLTNALLTLQTHQPSLSAQTAQSDHYDNTSIASLITNDENRATTITRNTITTNNINTTTTVETAALQSIISELSRIQQQNSRLESQNAYILRKLGNNQQK